MTARTAIARTNLYLALGCIAFALMLAFLWIPLDTNSGLIEKVRRQVTIGDALAPTLAAFMIGLGGVLVLFQGRGAAQDGIGGRNLGFLARLLAGIAIAFALMRWTGPGVVWLAGLVSDQELTYRALRDTAPWKYLGFLTGGSFLIAALIAAVEGRVTGRTVVIAVCAVLVLIALYDLPFDDLLLPPNGDV
ncbi:MAG: hypothetical protein QNJ44_12125 [Rhodobacter sp.]|nr:hypothetical protein [Rhodobacter sp.]